MSDSYVGEIRMFGGNFAPAGWALCNGALLPISENDALFTLLGTTYGGDGVTTFALPDLRGRAPMHQGVSGGTSYVPGQQAGTETVTLTAHQLPVHRHPFLSTTENARLASPAGALPAMSTSFDPYTLSAPMNTMAPQSIQATGSSQPAPHENMQPYLAVSFIISLFGIFPSQG